MDTRREYLREQINIREFIARDLGKPKFKTSKYDSYQCPLHNESKGQSLAVYDDHWICFGKCNTTGDIVNWVMTFRSMGYEETIKSLMGSDPVLIKPALRKPRVDEPESPSHPPASEWQVNALRIVEYAEKLLWSRDGKRALDYLMNSRGLHRATIKEHRLGFIPGPADKFRYDLLPDWKDERGTVPIPCGVTIPHFAHGNLWAVRVRREDNIIGKYHGIRGGSKALYNADSVVPGWTLFITEGEFDAMLIDQVSLNLDLRNPVCVVSLASASNYKINRYWYPTLIGAPMIAARLDADAAGDKALEQLRGLSPVFRPCQVPVGKDVTDYYLLHGAAELKKWIDYVVDSEVMRHA